jgi:hypothetical protein
LSSQRKDGSSHFSPRPAAHSFISENRHRSLDAGEIKPNHDSEIQSQEIAKRLESEATIRIIYKRKQRKARLLE